MESRRRKIGSTQCRQGVKKFTPIRLLAVELEMWVNASQCSNVTCEHVHLCDELRRGGREIVSERGHVPVAFERTAV